MLQRRTLITGLVSLLAAPAIVRASSLMPVSGDIYRVWEYALPLMPPIHWPSVDEKWVWPSAYKDPNGHVWKGVWTFFGKHRNIYADEQIAFRKEQFEWSTPENALHTPS